MNEDSHLEAAYEERFDDPMHGSPLDDEAIDLDPEDDEDTSQRERDLSDQAHINDVRGFNDGPDSYGGGW